MSDLETMRVKQKNNKVVHNIDLLIDEVKKRPFLYDKRHEQYGNRINVNKGWREIAAILKKQPEEVKTKWRNLKDSFHRLERKIEFPPDDREQPVESYYTGQWVHFEKLLFLRDTRHNRTNNEDDVDPDVPEICLEGIKGEFDLSSHSLGSEAENNEDKNEEPENIFSEPIITFQNVLNGANIVANSGQNIEPRKRVLLEDLEEIEKKRRLLDLTPGEAVIDEDLFFVKSLVPFLRKLSPIRKLIVRNEMQNLLIKEMLCDNCRSFGPQPNCRCN